MSMTTPPDGRPEWEERVLKPALRKTPERRAEFQTSSGIPLERVYFRLRRR